MKFSFKNLLLNGFQMEDGIWFLGNDICRILGYQNPTQTYQDHTAEEDRKRLKYKASIEMIEANMRSELWSGNDFSDKILINESGLYCMIFGSKMEGAKEFKFWVTREVLPSIRSHGGYIDRQEELAPDDQEKIYKEVETLSKKVDRLTAKNKALAEQNDRLKKRWHSAITARDELKVQKKFLQRSNKKLSLNNKILTKDANEAMERVLHLSTPYIESVIDLAKELRIDFEKKHPEVLKKKPVPVPDTMTVDKYGFLVV